MIHFDEPHETGGNSHVTCTREQVIKYMKKFYSHLSDEDLIKEFCITYWAWEEKD